MGTAKGAAASPYGMLTPAGGHEIMNLYFFIDSMGDLKTCITIL